MTAPWQAMPTFVDGNVVDEADLNPLVFNLNLVRRAGRVLAGRILSSAGLQYSTSGTTELNMPKLQISNITVEANRPYLFGFTVYCQQSAAGGSVFFRVRQNTALTGAQLVLGSAVIPVASRDTNFTILLPWKPAAGGVMTFHASVQAPVGGVASVYGSSTTALWIEKAGDDGTEWALIP